MPRCLLNTVRRQRTSPNVYSDSAPPGIQSSFDGSDSSDCSTGTVRPTRSRQRKAVKRKRSLNNLSVVTRFYMHEGGCQRTTPIKHLADGPATRLAEPLQHTDARTRHTKSEHRPRPLKKKRAVLAGEYGQNSAKNIPKKTVANCWPKVQSTTTATTTTGPGDVKQHIYNLTDPCHEGFPKVCYNNPFVHSAVHQNQPTLPVLHTPYSEPLLRSDRSRLNKPTLASPVNQETRTTPSALFTLSASTTLGGSSDYLPMSLREVLNKNMQQSESVDAYSRPAENTVPCVFTSGFIMGNSVVPIALVQPMWLQTTPMLLHPSETFTSTTSQGASSSCQLSNVDIASCTLQNTAESGNSLATSTEIDPHNVKLYPNSATVSTPMKPKKINHSPTSTNSIFHTSSSSRESQNSKKKDSTYFRLRDISVNETVKEGFSSNSRQGNHEVPLYTTTDKAAIYDSFFDMSLKGTTAMDITPALLKGSSEKEVKDCSQTYNERHDVTLSANSTMYLDSGKEISLTTSSTDSFPILNSHMSSSSASEPSKNFNSSDFAETEKSITTAAVQGFPEVLLSGAHTSSAPSVANCASNTTQNHTESCPSESVSSAAFTETVESEGNTVSSIFVDTSKGTCSSEVSAQSIALEADLNTKIVDSTIPSTNHHEEQTDEQEIKLKDSHSENGKDGPALTENMTAGVPATKESEQINESPFGNNQDKNCTRSQNKFTTDGPGSGTCEQLQGSYTGLDASDSSVTVYPDHNIDEQIGDSIAHCRDRNIVQVKDDKDSGHCDNIKAGQQECSLTQPNINSCTRSQHVIRHDSSMDELQDANIAEELEISSSSVERGNSTGGERNDDVTGELNENFLQHRNLSGQRQDSTRQWNDNIPWHQDGSGQRHGSIRQQNKTILQHQNSTAQKQNITGQRDETIPEHQDSLGQRQDGTGQQNENIPQHHDSSEQRQSSTYSSRWISTVAAYISAQDSLQSSFCVLPCHISAMLTPVSQCANSTLSNPLLIPAGTSSDEPARSPMSNLTNQKTKSDSFNAVVNSAETKISRCPGRKKEKSPSLESMISDPVNKLISSGSRRTGTQVSYCRDARQDALLFYSTYTKGKGEENPKKFSLSSRTKTSSHKCPECSLVFPSLTDLSFHLLVHQRDRSKGAGGNYGEGKNTEGGECGQGEGGLAEDTRNKCGVCSRVFTRSWLLKGHMRTHTGERPFRCTWPQCQRAFADKSNLRSHTLIHTTTAKSFSCPKCSRAFSQKRYLHKHMLEVCRII